MRALTVPVVLAALLVSCSSSKEATSTAPSVSQTSTSADDDELAFRAAG